MIDDISQSDPLPRSGDPAIDEWRGLGDLIALTVERVTAPIEGVHRAIARRWFGLAGPVAAPAHRTYQTLTAGIYDSVRIAGSALGMAVGLGASVAGVRDRLPPLWRSPAGAGIRAAVNAVWGDELERRQSPLRTELSLRDGEGAPIRPDPVALARAFPHPTPRLVVLLHGLGETERCWLPPPGAGGPGRGLVDALTAEAFTPLLARYNSGRRVEENGTLLAELLEEITESWSVEVEEVSLVGNSMGGLVARASIGAGRNAGHEWTDSVRHLVTLGTPHLGAPLEKGANLMSWSLGLTPESRPLSEFIDLRSVGIKDLRFGAATRDDRSASGDGGVAVTHQPEGVEQHFVAATITENPSHPIGILVGDLVVRTGSGTGRGRRRRIEATDVRVLGGRRHSDLALDPAVHEQVCDWLEPSRNVDA